MSQFMQKSPIHLNDPNWWDNLADKFWAINSEKMGKQNDHLFLFIFRQTFNVNIKGLVCCSMNLNDNTNYSLIKQQFNLENGKQQKFKLNIKIDYFTSFWCHFSSESLKYL